jgi:hypothetical protein
MPEYYEDFLKQGELVRQRLDTVGEPETSGLARVVRPQDGGALADSFDTAAHRHRHPDESGPVG